MAQQAAIKDLPKGEYIRLKDSDTAPVWVRGDYDRSRCVYELHRADDINHSTHRHGAARVFHGFTY